MDSDIVLMVNGEARELTVPAERTLLDVLREDLDLTGAKMACDDGECGSCIVLLNDKPQMSCKLRAVRAQGKALTTIEGLGGDGVLHPLQEALSSEGPHHHAHILSADIIVEDTFKTARREHAAMEPEAALAYLDESGMLVVKSPLYHPFVQGQESIANTLALDVDKVRVICPAMGGNFGKRGDAQAPTVAGLLALKTGYPVRVVFSRSESLLGSSKTPSTIMTYKIGARKDGRVVALQATVHRNMGIWAPYLAGITTQGQELCRFESIPATLSHITGPYEIPNVRATLYDVVANGPRSVPLRGTSGGYLPLAIESLLDRIAAELDIDPVEFRRRNALGVGSRTHLGQVMTDSVGIRAELDALREPYRQCLSRPRGKVNGTPWRRGVGVGCGWRSITYVNMPDISAAVELLPDGRVRVLAGSVEQGQGAMTELAQIVSEALDLPMEAIEVTIGDTCLAPYPVPTFSSITTLVTGKAVQNAAEPRSGSDATRPSSTSGWQRPNQRQIEHPLNRKRRLAELVGPSAVSDIRSIEAFSHARNSRSSLRRRRRGSASLSRTASAPPAPPRTAWSNDSAH